MFDLFSYILNDLLLTSVYFRDKPKKIFEAYMEVIYSETKGEALSIDILTTPHAYTPVHTTWSELDKGYMTLN